MLKKYELPLEQLGDRAGIIPGREPQLQLTIPRIPVTEPELGSKIIPVCEPTLGGNEMKYVADCIETNWISSAGKYITRFEDQFARKCGAKHGVACANGTVALHLALATMGIGPGDEVILPTFTMIATMNAVTYTGASPVLIDSELGTWNMDVTQLESKITPRTKAIMPVHTYGHPVDMDPVLEIARKHNLYVIDDAAEAHGAEYKGRKIGSLGDATCFSFYANKIITTGEGGMVLTNSDEVAKIARNLRDHAFSEERHFWHKYLGYNYRMTNLQAAVGLAQTERFAELIECRRNNAMIYNALLKDVPGLTLPPEASNVKNVFWMYGVMVQPEFGVNRDELRERLAKRGIETRAFFVPMHLQPIYYEKYGHERHPRAEELCAKGFYFPSSSSLTREEIEFIAGVVKQIQVEA
jgi:perosamine synthetase